MKIFFLFFIAYTLSLNNASTQTFWQKQNTPINDGLHDVFFLDDLIGWAYSYGTGIVIKTIDGGGNWEVISRLDSIYFEQIQFVDKSHGWLCGERGCIYKTIDGGKNWIDVSPAFPERIVKAFDWGSKVKPKGWYILLYSMHFFNSDEGFVAGGKYQPSEKNGWQNMQHIFLTTSNGGNSWVQNEQAPDAFLYHILFLDDSLGYASSDRNVFRTTNSGETWTVVYKDTSSKKSQIRGLYFLNSKIGFGVNFNGRIIKTTDGAQSWEEGKITENRLRSIIFIDEENGFIVGDRNKEEGVLYQTKNGGTTWQKIDGNYPDLHRIKLSRNKIWIVGKEGIILMREKY